MVDLFVMGRMDDVINVAGHASRPASWKKSSPRIGAVAECAVFGVADELKGQLPLGLVVLEGWAASGGAGNSVPGTDCDGSRTSRCRGLFPARGGGSALAPRPVQARFCAVPCANWPTASSLRRPPPSTTLPSSKRSTPCSKGRV